MTTTTKTTKRNRGHLLRAAKQGRLWLRCRNRLTDDYAWDAATNFGREDAFRPVVVRNAMAKHPLEQTIEDAYARGASHAEVEPLLEELRAVRRAHDAAERDRAGDGLLLSESDFRYQTGWCNETTFGMYSNLSYEYEIR